MSSTKNTAPRKRGMSAEEVLAMHSERSPDGCRLWTRSTDRAGRPQVQYGGTVRRAHELAWELEHSKPVPEGYRLEHTCQGLARARGEDERGYLRCIETSHLVLAPLPMTKWRARDTPDEALGARIRAARLGAGLSQIELAELAGLGRSTLQLIERGARVDSAAVEAVLTALGLSSAPAA
ncbi:helix-turn-helix domain-containing protein [Leucobacter chromiireducens]|nr:helix-turn-helix transcriptional regulator [Leucobacter chromiireducens]